MTTRKKSSSRARPAVIALAAQCSIKDALALQTELQAALQPSRAVTVDASAVERIDTAALQLLCAFAQQCSAEGRALKWRGDCTVLQDTAGQLGLHEVLGLPQSVAA